MRNNCSIQLLDFNKKDYDKMKKHGGEILQLKSKGLFQSHTLAPEKYDWYIKLSKQVDAHENFLEKREHENAGTWDQDWDDDEPDYDAFTDLGMLEFSELEWYRNSDFGNIDEKKFKKLNEETSLKEMPYNTLTLKENNKESFKTMFRIFLAMEETVYYPPELIDSNFSEYSPEEFWKLIQDKFSDSNIVVLSVHLWNNHKTLFYFF